MQCVGIPILCAVSWTSNQSSGGLLAGRDEVAHALSEDLGAAAGHRAEAGVLQHAQDSSCEQLSSFDMWWISDAV